MPYRYSRSPALVRIQELVTIYYFNISPDRYFGGESHPFWEMVYVDSGSISARNGDREFIAKAGDLLFHAPDVFHWARGDGEHHASVFIISFSVSAEFMEQFRDMHIQLPKKLRSLLSAIIMESNDTYFMNHGGLELLPDAQIGGEQLIRIYLEQFLILLARRGNGGTPPQSLDLAGEMVIYLNNRIYGDLSIPELCRDMHYGRSYLSAQFRRATGQSIMQYYRMLKINEAKRLLRLQNLSVAEISAKLCFDTPQYFSRVFREATGMTPGRFRSMVTV